VSARTAGGWPSEWAAAPCAFQHLLDRARWDADQVRDQLRNYVLIECVTPFSYLPLVQPSREMGSPSGEPALETFWGEGKLLECQLLIRGYSQLRGMVTARVSGRCLFVERLRERLPPYCAIPLTFGNFQRLPPVTWPRPSRTSFPLKWETLSRRLDGSALSPRAGRGPL